MPLRGEDLIEAVAEFMEHRRGCRATADADWEETCDSGMDAAKGQLRAAVEGPSEGTRAVDADMERTRPMPPGFDPVTRTYVSREYELADRIVCRTEHLDDPREAIAEILRGAPVAVDVERERLIGMCVGRAEIAEDTARRWRMAEASDTNAEAWEEEARDWRTIAALLRVPVAQEEGRRIEGWVPKGASEALDGYKAEARSCEIPLNTYPQRDDDEPGHGDPPGSHRREEDAMSEGMSADEWTGNNILD